MSKNETTITYSSEECEGCEEDSCWSCVGSKKAAAQWQVFEFDTELGKEVERIIKQHTGKLLTVIDATYTGDQNKAVKDLIHNEVKAHHVELKKLNGNVFNRVNVLKYGDEAVILSDGYADASLNNPLPKLV